MCDQRLHGLCHYDRKVTLHLRVHRAVVSLYATELRCSYWDSKSHRHVSERDKCSPEARTLLLKSLDLPAHVA